jgi:putative membrane protein
MWIWWLIVLVAMVSVIWLIARGSRSDARPPEDSPERVLKRRYARGDIDEETYEHMLAELRK